MTLSVVFLLTTLPNVVYFLKIDDWVPENDDPHTEARLSLAFAVTNLLYYTNNATNFFLYCLAGTRFRRAMCQTFGCRRAPEARSGRPEGRSGRPEARSGRPDGVEQLTGTRTNTNNRLRRTVEAPLGGTNSVIPAADAGCITLSTNVTIHPSDQ